jgi:Flp pilus assembly protein TadG
MASRRHRGSKGATIVEFALVFPFFLVLVLGLVDFGLYFLAQHTLQFATREGVRLALVGRTINDESGNALSREASIIKTIRDKAILGIDPGALLISIYPVNPDYSDPTNWQNTQDAGQPGGYMRVTTRYEFRFVTPVIGSFVPNGRIQMQAQATYRNELFN